MIGENRAWNNFVKSGAVTDYLTYREIKRRGGRVASGAADNRRSDTERTEHKR